MTRALNLLNDYQLLAFDELDSTNEEAKRIARTGASHGAMIWAKRQSEGRGRTGRTWISKEGNLYVSALLAPGCDIATASQLSFVAALAARDTVVGLLGDTHTVQCKWPNDILVDGKKIAGILLESFTPPPEGKLWVIVGCGINVDSYPKDVDFPATSLMNEGVDLISAKIVLSRFIHHFIERYNAWQKRGFMHIRREWLKHAWLLGEQVRIVLPNEELKGKFNGVEEGGSMVLQLAPGKRQVIPAGELFSLRQIEEVE